jgi:prefoldin subunit 5
MANKNYSANLKIGAIMSSSVGRVFGSVKTKIKDQEATLKKLRAAYKDASKGTGEYAGKLDELQREIDQTEAKLKRMKAAANFSLGSVGSAFSGDLKRLATGAGIAAGAIAAVGASVYTVTKGFVDWADDIGDSAEALQMSTQALQTWQFAAATVGVGGSKMTASIARFSKAISDGSDATAETLGKLGINAKRIKKLGLDQQLEVIAEAFKDYKGADRAAIAMKLFGKSGYQLAGILAKGKKGLDDFRKAGEETGAVLDDEAAEAAGKAASALDMMGITMIGLRNTIAIQFVPALTRMVDKFTVLVRENGPQIREWATRFATLIETRVVPALGKFLDKLPGIIEGLASFATNAYEVGDALQKIVGGWDNLGLILLAANFAPTILALGKMAKALYALGPAWVVGMGPVAWVIGAIAGIGLVLFSIFDEGGPLDILGKMFPDTMGAIRDSAGEAANYISDKIDMITEKIEAMFKALDRLTGLSTHDLFFGEFGGKASTGKPDYTLPRTNYSGILGVVPKGDRLPSVGDSLPKGRTGESGMVLPPREAPAATKEDLLEYLKPQSNNTYNINVTAPGANGDDIAERIRRSFQTKPLFDSDGALAPG